MDELNIWEWLDIETLGYCVVVFAVAMWCFLISIHLRRQKGEDNPLAFIFSTIGIISGFLAFPVTIIVGIPVYCISNSIADSREHEGFMHGKELGEILGNSKETKSSNTPTTEERENYAISYLANKYNLEILKRINSVLSHFELNDNIESIAIIYISFSYLIPQSKREGKFATSMFELFYDSLKQSYNLPLSVLSEKFDTALNILEEWELTANTFLNSKYNTTLYKLHCENRGPFYLCLVVLALALKVPKNFDAADELVALYKYVMSIAW